MSEELFDNEFLKKLEYLNLVARRLVLGRRQALRQSVKKGASIEFREYREYSPGDDPRTVDWLAYARLGELFIKLYRHEEELDLWVLLDASASMQFGAPNKFDHARRLAAALSYIGLANLDSASIIPFADDLRPGRARLRGRGQIFRLLDFLRSMTPSGTTTLSRAIQSFLARVRRPALIVVISDFYGLQDAERGLDRLRFFKHEIEVIQVASPWEIDPPIRGELRLVDAETGEREDLTITDGMLRRYRAAFANQSQALRRYSMRYHIGFSMAPTDLPFDVFIRRTLERGGLLA